MMPGTLIKIATALQTGETLDMCDHLLPLKQWLINEYI